MRKPGSRHPPRGGPLPGEFPSSGDCRGRRRHSYWHKDARPPTRVRIFAPSEEES
ncbi:MAG: hypothetical protein MZV64_63975 [Ignavibacteriales bacterium]|nr:hypothetical protein [Ignavibacteriales bacterium]